MTQERNHRRIAYASAVIAVMAVLWIWKAPVHYVAAAFSTLEADAEVASPISTHFVDVPGLVAPQAYLAQIDAEGWRDSDRQILDAKIQNAELLGMVDASNGEPVSEPDATDNDRSVSLIGQRVIAAVDEDAAADIREGESNTVHLVMVPSEQGATFAIDKVVEGTVRVEPTATLRRVESLSAYSSPIGSKVVLHGYGFGPEMLDSSVVVCGVEAEVVTWSDTAVAFYVPSGASKPGYVGVVVDGVTSNGVYFVPYVSPRLTSITPSSGSAGSIVEIVGTGFGATQGDGWVSFGGTAAQVVSWSDTSISVRVPQGVTAGYAGVVRHGLTSNGKYFAPYGHPRVTAVSRTRVLSGELVTLNGTDFGTGGEVVLGGMRITPDTWSNTTVTFVVPEEAPSGYVGVRRDGTLTSNGIYMTVAPRLYSISSWWGQPGGQLTVTGEGFGDVPDGKFVQIGSGQGEVVSWSDSEIVVTIPADASSGYVGVGTTKAMSNGKYFVVVHKASITAVDATTVSPGQQITVVGANFGAPHAKSFLTISGKSCEIVSWSDSEIVATVCDGVSSGYVGVVKQGVASNGIFVQAVP